MTQIPSTEPRLARRLGLFDTTMLVMGGIIGSGIFINPYVVAQQVPSTILILAAWTFGGLIALAGAFIYAELSSQTSTSGGQYVYLRDAFHPALAFVYGWALLLVTQSGGMARYVTEHASAGMIGVNIGVPVPREPFSFGGWNESRFGSNDITGRSSIEFWTKLKKTTTKWNPEAGVNWMS